MTRKQRHLLTRIIVAAVLFLAGSLLHLPELAEMAVFLVCYVVVGWDIVWKAITNILHGQVFDENFLMGGLGSDAAIEAADVVLMTDEPSKIAAVMKIARKTIRIANQNIVFALGVKFLVLILGALGYANMWAAVFADVGVSIIAILNAIRAMRVKLPDMPVGSTNQG